MKSEAAPPIMDYKTYTKLKNQTTDTPLSSISQACDIDEKAVKLSGVYDSTRKGFVTPVNVTRKTDMQQKVWFCCITGE
ncbi:hypothetical protein ACFLXY_06440 [Chloroflexota bacterium]